MSTRSVHLMSCLTHEWHARKSTRGVCLRNSYAFSHEETHCAEPDVALHVLQSATAANLRETAMGCTEPTTPECITGDM